MSVTQREYLLYWSRLDMVTIACGHNCIAFFIGILSGVAAACEEIVAEPTNAFRYTARGNLVAVITNGTAVLGLGNIGPLAAKPVMEGKGVLFKKFAGIDVFDIELAERDPDKLIDMIATREGFGDVLAEGGLRAAKKYTLLTIGDGLVGMIPAILISTAAGIIVTRVPAEKADTASTSGATKNSACWNGTYSPNGTRCILRYTAAVAPARSSMNAEL